MLLRDRGNIEQIVGLTLYGELLQESQNQGNLQSCSTTHGPKAFHASLSVKEANMKKFELPSSSTFHELLRWRLWKSLTQCLLGKFLLLFHLSLVISIWKKKSFEEDR